MKFRVERVLSLREDVYVIVRALSEGSFSLPGNAKLGGVRVKLWVEQPRKLLPDGKPDHLLFAFALSSAADQVLLVPGSELELTGGPEQPS